MARQIGMFTKNTQEDTERGRDSGDAAPCTECDGAVASLGELRGQRRQGRRDHHRRTYTLHQARADEHALRLREPADEGRGAEQSRAGHQQQPPTDEVGGSSAEQHEPAVGEQVGAQHPLQVLHREVQMGTDRRQRHVDDGRVDEVEHADAAQEQQRQLALPGREERGLFHGGGPSE